MHQLTEDVGFQDDPSIMMRLNKHTKIIIKKNCVISLR